MKILAIIFFIAWLISIYLLSREKMTFFKFIIGVVGGFIFTLYFGKVFLDEFITVGLLNVLNIISINSDSMNVFVANNAVTIFSGKDTLSYFITYECSGIIEMIVFMNIFVFYPLFNDNLMKKFAILCSGMIAIFTFNIIRIMFMSYIVIWFGIGTFFVAHVIVARLLFIALNILLYYVVLTMPHVKKQKAGDYSISEIIK